VLLAAAVALVIGAGPAVAASAKKPSKAPCWKALINDWYDGRIDGSYPIHCYREALHHLPTDVDTYSSARDDIRQALQERIAQSHRKKSSGTGGTSTGGTNNGGGSSGNGGGGNSGGGPSKGDSGSGGPIKGAFNAGKPGSADSVPVPLIVLGGVAVLLMAAGAVGFLARRTRTRKLQLASLPQTGPDGPAPGP
jgi:hypothetical protein